MKYVYIGAAVLIAAVVIFAIVEKVSPAGWGWWGETNTSRGLAIRGYDPVAYFEDGAPLAGDEQFAHDWGGATWYFASAANRDAFAGDPDRYAPQFGGFCSFAMSKGFTADASPDAWHLRDGELYLFADQKVRDSWVEQLESGLLDSAEKHWAKRRN